MTRRAWPEGRLEQLLARAQGQDRCACGTPLQPLDSDRCWACRESLHHQQDQEAEDQCR